MKKLTTYLTVIMAMVFAVVDANAQGGLTPLSGSTHNYTITPESTSNTLLWSVVEATGYTINSQSVVAATSVANITWTAAGTYNLQFIETNSTSCSTIKKITVTVSENTFDVSVVAPAAICNDKSGTANPTGNATTSISIPVNMVTGVSGFNPNWEFTFTLTPGAGATITNVAALQGTLSGTGPYTLTGLTSTSGTGSVDVTMDVSGDIYTVLAPVLTITSAKELTYQTTDKDNDDWTATQVINAIPNTSTITTD